MMAFAGNQVNWPMAFAPMFLALPFLLGFQGPEPGGRKGKGIPSFEFLAKRFEEQKRLPGEAGLRVIGLMVETGSFFPLLPGKGTRWS